MYVSTTGHASTSSLFDSENLLNNASENVGDPIDNPPARSGNAGPKLNPRRFARPPPFPPPQRSSPSRSPPQLVTPHLLSKTSKTHSVTPASWTGSKRNY
uniref:Uncharacterized protein n=1 Tax=Physcomitrium patens TaxID=3218 RepID=A0A2K1JK80_PHYPA|nr:hypothetical protein PHYPA_016794 [Physcomitrium patens]